MVEKIEDEPIIEVIESLWNLNWSLI
jgi:hypothetical protein